MNTLNKIFNHVRKSNEMDMEFLFHDITQTLRVSGVNLIFRQLANYPDFLQKVWNILKPGLVTQEFEAMADVIRNEAVELASLLSRDNALPESQLGESQAYQIQAALDLYHYINPKLLLISSALLKLIEKEVSPLNRWDNLETNVLRGIPPRMFPMEMVDENPQVSDLREIFQDMKQTLNLTSINSDYRTLALWPTYLKSAWNSLKPLVKETDYINSANQLRELSQTLVSDSFLLATEEDLESNTYSVLEIKKEIQQFQKLLPALILNISLLQLDWKTETTLQSSPFPLPVEERSLQ
jgi:hypothetical protein